MFSVSLFPNNSQVIPIHKTSITLPHGLFASILPFDLFWVIFDSCRFGVVDLTGRLPILQCVIPWKCERFRG